ncbi:hypothetical protein ATE92_2706 [Ulvibacter sp. MAR_2010_11]|uniref:CPBP family intramembrane glutamic endopeptidase n=1 Tax=Ulvibacter sp. MAR_2010_11 TaxID=1250229 RepID=UPI000CC8F410|nr:type II CAAX endopeptidase family protein [Ulvibacter sp. MAR_2010_11]PKA84512.1 hypothetical protein ATE92_2706 [Ulvibacter sp. MAR_2010_11]
MQPIIHKKEHFKNDRKIMLAILELLLVYGFIFNPWTTFPYRFIIVSAIVLIVTYWKYKSFTPLGLKTNVGVVKTVIIALLLFLIIEPVFDFIIQPLINRLTHKNPDFSAFQAIAGNTSAYLKYLCFAWISAAIGEELLFRGYMFNQLKLILPNFKIKTVVIVVITAILFCLPHAYQGVGGVISTFVFGLIFGAVYVKTNYNLWIAILLHGLIDSLFLTLAYTNKLGYYSSGIF